MTAARAGTAAPGGLLVVLSGPSGVGKDTVLRRVRDLDPRLGYSVSFTTRAPRPGEVDGVSYSFIDARRFHEMAADGRFLEWAEVHGSLYGTSRERVEIALRDGSDIVLKIDVQGARRVRERLDQDCRDSLGRGLFVFLLPPSLDELRARLIGRRTEGAEILDRRMQRAEEELAEVGSYDVRIVNADVDRAARELLAHVERWRAHGSAPAAASDGGAGR